MNAHMLILAAVLATSANEALPSIDPAHKFAWGENIGWTNWRDANSADEGVRVLANHLRGYFWAENVGWINTGDGGPYANTSETTFGVNVNPGTGVLSGYAWGENIGWITFDTSGLGAQAARYDASSGRLRGYAWGENVGWINLDDAVHYVAAPPPCAGDANGDGHTNGADLSVLLAQFGSSVTPGTGSDFNGDGIVNGADLSVLLSKFGCGTS